MLSMLQVRVIHSLSNVCSSDPSAALYIHLFASLNHRARQTMHGRIIQNIEHIIALKKSALLVQRVYRAHQAREVGLFYFLAYVDEANKKSVCLT